VEKSLELLDEMEEKVVPSEVTYSITITACGNGGQWSKALELWIIMRKKVVHQSHYHNSAITAMSKAAKQSSRVIMEVGNLDKSSRTLSQMKADGIEP
jgi:pentatricopeptide repeat protein